MNKKIEIFGSIGAIFILLIACVTPTIVASQTTENIDEKYSVIRNKISNLENLNPNENRHPTLICLFLIFMWILYGLYGFDLREAAVFHIMNVLCKESNPNCNLCTE